jgi:hypothetical protein
MSPPRRSTSTQGVETRRRTERYWLEIPASASSSSSLHRRRPSWPAARRPRTSHLVLLPSNTTAMTIVSSRSSPNTTMPAAIRSGSSRPIRCPAAGAIARTGAPPSSRRSVRRSTPRRLVARRIWIRWFQFAAYPKPESTLTLYRGAVSSRARGMAWTKDDARALWFAWRFGFELRYDPFVMKHGTAEVRGD